MLLLSPNHCTRRRFIVCIRPWEISSREAARVRFQTCCCLLLSAVYATRGAIVMADGVLCEDGVSDSLKVSQQILA